MSYLMDYGPDWPPAPEPAPSSRPARHRWSLRRKCAAWTLTYALIAVLGSLALDIRQQYAPPFDPHDAPSASPHAHSADAAHRGIPARHHH